MTPLDLLFLLRRHKWVLIVAVVVGLVAGWITAPGTRHGSKVYEATHTLIVNPQSPTPPNLDQAALLATTGDVPAAAAKALGTTEDRVVGTVSATADLKVSSVAVTGRSTDPAFAVRAADAVASALVDQLSGTSRSIYDGRVAELTKQASDLRAAVAAGPGSGSGALATFNATQNQLSQVESQLNQLTISGPPPGVLVTVEAAKAHTQHTSRIAAPDGKPARAGLLGAFGLLVGLAAVFALDRLDTRIHTKSGAEAAFGYPVLAEIPPLPAGAHRELISETHPGSPFVEAYRGLRTYLALAAEEHGLAPTAPGQGAVVLVTSPLAGEGKTTSVAHIAAMLGEVGRSVLVVSGDFRRPRLHELFHRDRSPGLSEVLGGGPGAPDIADLDLATGVRGVQFIASGAPVTNPAVVVKRTPAVLEAARPFWEFIVVDSAPLLVANDTSDLARAANGVIVLARTGRTTVDAAQRTAELLGRIEAPVLGVVLIAATETPSAYRYYRAQYYGEDDQPTHWWHRRRRASGASRPGSRGGGSSNGAGTGNGSWKPASRPVDTRSS